MKWGSKSEKGCNRRDCDKARPLLCPKSLDMKCVDQACSFKPHILKCARQEPVHVQGNAAGGGQHSHGVLEGGPDWRSLEANQAIGQSVGGPQDQHPGHPLHDLGNTRTSIQTGQNSRPHQAVYGGVSPGQLFILPPPNYARAGLGGHAVGYPAQQNHQHPSFQGLTVQQLLEAQTRYLEQELAKQR